MAGERPIPIPAQALRDIAGLIGVGLLGYGAWLHYPPLGFAVGGGALLLLVIAGTLRGDR